MVIFLQDRDATDKDATDQETTRERDFFQSDP